VAGCIDLENMIGGYNNGAFSVDCHVCSDRFARSLRSRNWRERGDYEVIRELDARRRVHLQQGMLENAVEPVQIFSFTGSRKNPEEGRRKFTPDVQIVVDALSVSVQAPWAGVFVIDGASPSREPLGHGDHQRALRRTHDEPPSRGAPSGA
jgi:hypothetical protein